MAIRLFDMGTEQAVSDFLDRMMNWAAHQPTIAAVALVGSHARGEARPDSVIDLVLLCEEPHAFLAHTSWVHHFGAVEERHTEEAGWVHWLRDHRTPQCRVV